MSAARRESLGYCAETCPEVDSAFGDLTTDLRELIPECLHDKAEKLIDECIERVKDKGTLLLRAALESACMDKQEIESDRDDLAKECRNLNAEVADLKAEVARLERELEQVTA